MLGKLLAPANMNLIKYEAPFELRLRAATIDNGNDIIDPNIVATNAIFIVSIMPIHAVEHVKSNNGYTVQTGYA
jgi:hypothetical protein